MGIVTAMSASGILCSRGFSEGWNSVFYTFGINSETFKHTSELGNNNTYRTCKHSIDFNYRIILSHI